MKFFKTSLFDPYLLLSLVTFLALSLPFIGVIPHLDGNIDFVKNYDFASGGFSQLFQNWHSVHPPGKEFVTFIFFSLFGLTKHSYSLIGPVFGVLGIILFYSLASELFGKTPGRLSAFLLSVSPLFLSVGLFSLTDYLLTVFIIGSFYFYLKVKIPLLALFLNLSFLTKESGLIAPLSIILIELLSIKKPHSPKKSFPATWLALLLPFIFYYLWSTFLKINDKPIWSDWNFSETAAKGTLYTLFRNVVSLKLFNTFAYQNWLHLFVLNFNWFYWSLLLLGGFIIFKKAFKQKSSISIPTSHSGRVTLSILLFCVLYTLIVLSFQTYTIPRYTLPVLPFLFLGAARSLEKIKKISNTFSTFLLMSLFLIIGISLFSSVDPISLAIWGKEKVLGQEIYAVRKKLAGNDGITYNMQYALIAKKRTRQILAAKSTGGTVFSEDCFWIYPDPRNDRKTNEILKLSINFSKPCLTINN